MGEYRWKVACINWSQPGVPKALAYLVDKDGYSVFGRVFPTHAEAIRYADRAARSGGPSNGMQS